MLPGRGEIVDFIRQQLNDNAIKIANFWKKKGI
jgi:hypothetical protein